MNTVFFGHQSVGQNILDGIRRVEPSCSIVAYPGFAAATLAPGIHHCKIGSNGDPFSKIDSFRDIVEQVGQRLDVAMMKLCYVDVTRHTDVEPLFRHYETVMLQLERGFPDLRIIHITMPLRTLRLGIRSRLRLVLGQPIVTCEDNLRRETFNELMRSAFGSPGRLFDLASLESTRADGTQVELRYRSAIVRSMCPDYSDDGGHPNTRAAETIGAKLLQFCRAGAIASRQR